MQNKLRLFDPRTVARKWAKENIVYLPQPRPLVSIIKSKENTSDTLCPILLLVVTKLFFFFLNFVGPRSILWGKWYPLLRTSDDSVHGFQSQGGLIIVCALLALVCCYPQSHLWLLGMSIEPRSLTCEVSTIPCIVPVQPGLLWQNLQWLNRKFAEI